MPGTKALILSKSDLIIGDNQALVSVSAYNLMLCCLSQTWYPPTLQLSNGWNFTASVQRQSSFSTQLIKFTALSQSILFQYSANQGHSLQSISFVSALISQDHSL